MGRVRLVIGIVTCVLLLPPNAAAQAVQVIDGSVHHQNIQEALKLLRQYGENAAADQIQESLDDGDIYADPKVSVNGETSMYNNVSLAPWAMWTVEQKLNEKTFANAFVELTKKAVTAQKQPCSNDTENVIRKATPNRWNDIQRVLSAAGVPLPR